MEENKKAHSTKVLAEEESKIATQYIAGRAISEIVEEFSISHGTLYSILRRQGVQHRKGASLTESSLKLLTMTAEDRRDLIKRYQSGERTRDLQNKFGITKHALYSLLDQEGVQRRGRAVKRQKLSKITSSNTSAVPQYLVNDTPIQIERDGDVLHINITPRSSNAITEVRVTFNKE
ncbi:hypothetical protein Goe25_01520 [Bacillus phage vB_BsuM-Goe25]|nr:hypothetical protein [Bacillus phage BM-P1]WCS69780.1 hypothetical protein Goe25_01520 [Bacillus phage vB_BsuM-Goe25]